MCCRVAMLRMQQDGIIELPRSQITVVRKRAHFELKWTPNLG